VSDRARDGEAAELGAADEACSWPKWAREHGVDDQEAPAEAFAAFLAQQTGGPVVVELNGLPILLAVPDAEEVP
jgi:hypothetical protein